MSRMVELPDDIYQQVEEAAAAAGTTPAGWIAAQLPQQESDTPAESQVPISQRLAGRVGRIASGGIEALSRPSGNAFTDYLVAKKREGRL
ncbi:hypothetical protein [Longimicrobium sp.]|uniref:hypothetical protein n=1 Tax=Longimicrobium sp. TaxID=2029185 RepID=UPI002B82D0B0|nr:hypothetical protein [Longimicrobium sp.]HSU15372.1 hypothetical protein [Longimicrobium sp.]